MEFSVIFIENVKVNIVPSNPNPLAVIGESEGWRAGTVNV